MKHPIQRKTFLLIAMLLLALVVSACAPETPPPPTATLVATLAPTEAPAAAEAATEAAPTEATVEEATPAPTEEPVEEPTPAPTEEPAQESALEGVTWLVTAYVDESGATAEPISDATLTFQNGRISGNAGCNGFFAAYTLDGGDLSITMGGSTLMMCEDAVMAQEQAILANLGQAAAYAVTDGVLTLLNAEGTALLTLSERTEPGLTDAVWLATMVNNGREAVTGLIEGTQITAIFGEDGSLSGTSGCNNYVTSYTTDGDSIEIGMVASTMMFCAEPEGVMDQETAYVTMLPTAATYSIQNGVLELRTAEGALVASYIVDNRSVVAPSAAMEEAAADPDPVVEDAKAAAAEFAVAADATPRGRVTAPLGVNIRVGPGTEFPIVGVAPQNAEGEIVGRSLDGRWWAARVPTAPNGQGWVAADYVEAINADNVPVLPAPPLPQPETLIQEGQPYQMPQGVILYSASRVIREGNRVYEVEDIYAVDAAGGQPRMVANNAMQPALSPDRGTLAFYSKQSDKLGIGGYDAATGRRLRFSAFIEDQRPRWSPTGDRIVFASNRAGDRHWRIYIVDAVSQDLPENMVYTELDFGKDPDWRPTQEQLIIKGCDPTGNNCGLYTLNTGGAGRTQLTNVESDSTPRWTPDGNAVVFMSEGRDGNWEIYRANVADGSVTRLTNDPAPDGLPAVSPDGSQIAFISKRGGAWGLWVMPATGGAATQVTAIPGELPDWLMQAVDWPR